ncbi:hypothetical protein L6452_01369 [Arctium lappa]|uniref:Uncharacterized protein n=1 Tax=Arctium lappa TaxID=4217 RepID=A0ACB9FFX1_ARCLA|nr:hypothetical protein L6452_01369 [Arctium lappa]
METHKQITIDLEGEDIDVHLFRSMIGSLMYLTASRPDIMFPVCVCARFQVKPKQYNLQAVKMIFRYLIGQPRLGLCVRNKPRLSTTEAEYIAAASCCSPVLWIQNQKLDYGVTFLHTPIFIDNSSAISIVNNPVKHSKTKHIEIRQEHSSLMATMAFINEHNEIAMLQKPKKVAGFHQMVDFLKSSHIAHALTVSPTIYIKHQSQFLANATIVTENGVQILKTRVCDKPLSVSEEVIRIFLHLDDAEGITSLLNEELFSNLSRMGYGGC